MSHAFNTNERKKPRPKAKRNIAGQRFGSWKVLSEAARSNCGRTRWNCICKCGKKKVVLTCHLVSGKSKGCGCVRRRPLTHGCSGANETPEYKAWMAMRQRCGNSKNPSFDRYGERGIFVSARWQRFENFLEDMGIRPSPKHSVDRINNNGPYAWWNCRWATKLDQMNNRSNSRSITWNGKTMSMSQWSRELNINREMLKYRLNAGWKIEDALLTPSGAK